MGERVNHSRSKARVGRSTAEAPPSATTTVPVMIDGGMREGTLMQLNNLEELLAKLSRAKETKQ